MGHKGSAKGESPTAPFVMEMARVVIGQKGDDSLGNHSQPGFGFCVMSRNLVRVAEIAHIG